MGDLVIRFITVPIPTDSSYTVHYNAAVRISSQLLLDNLCRLGLELVVIFTYSMPQKLSY